MQGKRILIVDDEENVISALKRTLVDENYEIEKASNGQEALENIEV